MRTKILTTLGVVALAGVASYWTVAGVPVAAADAGPQMTSIGPLAFGAEGVLFAADTQAATIYALELGDKANGGASGMQAVDAIDFASATPITQPVKGETSGVPYETITAMKGIEQLDLLDGSRTLALSRTDTGLNLVAVALP